ncbi:hypothetical protein BV20DRAFT_976104 [Pilatotrama ljubarskyi]|nr:hypothetical protein BV20DRAFT_976104 [Pilatotrama ljubarskyi]
MFSNALAVFTLLVAATTSWAQVADPAELASQYSLTTSTSIPFPTATLSNSDAQSFIVSGWSLSKGKIQQGASNIAFVSDPFPGQPAPDVTRNSTGPVLEVTYPEGQVGSEASGMQLFSLWNTSDSSTFQSMLVTYEVAFDADFNFVKGGKLPGLRGGPDPDGCSGGSAANGSNCFSTRLMWRKEAAGEVYAYIPTPNDICSAKDFQCNSDGFGTSIRRGAFSFAAGQWNRISLLVRLNQPTDTANGEVLLYYNDVKAIDEQVLQYRSSSDISIGGLWFSTFFGGSDDSWAPPSTVHAYFRNIELYGSKAPSNLTGQKVSGAARQAQAAFAASAWAAAAFGIAVAALGSLF